MVQITYIKAFTQDPKRGNPAVVIEGPIDAPETLSAVKKASCSVATVIDTNKADPTPIRFFYENGDTETFACGHATLAAAHVLLPRTAAKSSFINSKEQVIEIERQSDGRIAQKQSSPELQSPSCSTEDAAHALGLSMDSISSNIPIKLAGAPGKMKLMLPITTQATLIGIERSHERVMTLCEQTGATGLFPFSLDLDPCDAHARHFPNRDEEDLVCGVGSIALAHYLREHDVTSKNELIVRCGPGKEGLGDVIVRIDDDQFFLEGFAVVDESN